MVPKVQGVEFADYLREEQAGDYPEGRYEHALQVAAESGDQAELDVLFARRSRADVWRLRLILLAGIVFLTLMMKWLSPSPEPPAAPPPAPAKMKLPPPDHFPPTLDNEERDEAAAAFLQKIGGACERGGAHFDRRRIPCRKAGLGGCHRRQSVGSQCPRL